MDWTNVKADEEDILDTHYTQGRNGHSIDKVVIHHNAGNLTVEDCYRVWESREASAHYQVQSDGRIGQLVWDSDTAWHCGDFEQNQRSIGIEHADDSSNPWHISDACLDAGAHLVAAICRYYKLGRPEWGRNLFGHSDFSATACPASLAVGGSQHDEYVSRAQQWYDSMTGGASAPAAPASQPAPQPAQPAAPGGSVDELAQRVINGEFGTGEDRKTALGSRYDEVQARVNEILSGGFQASGAPDIDDLAQRTLNGEFGNGDQRKAALGSLYDAVQQRVNELCGQGGCSSGGADIDDLARRAINGEFGNGDSRRAALGDLYDAVQSRVNEMLS